MWKVLTGCVLAICAGLLLCAQNAQSQYNSFPPGVFGAGLGAPGGAAAYSGPGDVVSGALAWWGLRCYNNAYSGNVADVWDAATGNTTETLLTCSAGGTINQTVHTLAVTCAVSCEVATIYDQSGASSCSGACDDTATHAAGRPILTLNCIGSLPCMVPGTTGSLKSANLASTENQPFTLSVVAARTVTSAAQSAISEAGDQPSEGLFASALNTVSMYGGNAVPTATAADNVAHTLQYVFNNTTSNIYVDATSNAVSIATASAMGSGHAFVFPRLTGATETVHVFEAGWWPVGFTVTGGGQASLMHTNQCTYWGTTC